MAATLTISVIFATHDRPEHLRRAVASVVAQQYRPKEIILVNDGSQDLPADVAESVREAGIDCQTVRQPNPSLTRSRNAGIERANGEIVVLADDDLIFPPDYLSRLAELYGADTDHSIAGICGTYVEDVPHGLGWRMWDVASDLIATYRWRPRRSASRYLTLPPALRGRLRPTQRFVGGAVSMRRAVAAECRYADAFDGYALCEDVEFSYRVGQRYPLFQADELKLKHDPGPGGRGGMGQRGRMYAANLLYVSRHAMEPGAGAKLVLGVYLTGSVLLYTAYGLAGNRGNLAFAWGMVRQLAGDGWSKLKAGLCG